MFIVNKTVRGHYTISGGGGGVLDYLFIYIFSIRLGGALKMANLIRPSLGLQIYDLFREEPARSFISKMIHPLPPPPAIKWWPSRNLPSGLFCETQQLDVIGNHFEWLLGENNVIQDPLPLDGAPVWDRRPRQLPSPHTCRPTSLY